MLVNDQYFTLNQKELIETVYNIQLLADVQSLTKCQKMSNASSAKGSVWFKITVSLNLHDK